MALLGAGGVGAHAALSNSDSSQRQMPTSYPDSSHPDTTSPTSSPVPGVSPAATPSPTSTPAAPAAHHQQPALRLAITGSVSWIEVRRPGGKVFVSGLVRHGRHLTYRHGPLSVVIGNAAAVRVTRHGHTTRAGGPGEVVELAVPKGG